MVTIREIADQLASQAESVCQKLLPGGKRVAREWCVGSVNGEPGQSMKICLEGTKRGVWSDFATGEGGDMVDLWRTVTGQDMTDTLRDIKNYLGITDPTFEAKRQKEYRKPEAPKTGKKPVEGSKVLAYLTGERKLTAETLKAYRIVEAVDVGPFPGWKKQEPWQGPWIVFPSFDVKGELTFLKYLHVERKDGKKQTLVEANCRPILFGWQAIDKNAREITLCEGEIDAATLFQYGHPALSVPFGGGKGDKHEWLEHEFESLERFETIYLCMDNDDEGKTATEYLCSRLGMHRVKIVTLPRKDANKCLQDGIPKNEIDTAFVEAKILEPDELKRAGFFTQDVLDEFYPAGGKRRGFDTPWHNLQKAGFRFGWSEVTVVTGISGHGKSQALNHISVHAACFAGEKVCIASLEVKPRKTLQLAVRQVLCNEQPPREDIIDVMEMFNDRLFIFNHVGTGATDRILSAFEYAYRRYGVKVFVIDSLMKCGIASDNYQAQNDFVTSLCDFVTATDTHIFLVAHSRKKDDEGQAPGKLDVKGAGEITNLAHNTICIWRNKFKEVTLQVARETGYVPKGVKLEEVENQPDTILILDKCREDGEAEGKYSLWFHGPSRQFLASSALHPQVYHTKQQACPF